MSFKTRSASVVLQPYSACGWVSISRSWGGVVVDAHRFVVGGQHRVLFAPHSVPVDLRLGFLAHAVDHLPGLLLVEIVFHQLVQRDVVQNGQPFGLADVRQCFAGLPFEDGLAGNAQLFGHILRGKAALFAGVIQTACQAHGKKPTVFCFGSLSILPKGPKGRQPKPTVSPGFVTSLDHGELIGFLGPVQQLGVGHEHTPAFLFFLLYYSPGGRGRATAVSGAGPSGWPAPGGGNTA